MEPIIFLALQERFDELEAEGIDIYEAGRRHLKDLCHRITGPFHYENGKVNPPEKTLADALVYHLVEMGLEDRKLERLSWAIMKSKWFVGSSVLSFFSFSDFVLPLTLPPIQALNTGSL